MSDKILLVEDEELVGTMIQMNLNNNGYQVIWTKDGEEAINLGFMTGEEFDQWVKPEDMVGSLKV